jgi:hypothetical protein
MKEISVIGRDEMLPGGLGREASESMSFSAEIGWGDELVMPKEVDPNVRLTTVREYIQKEKNWEKVIGKL